MRYIGALFIFTITLAFVMQGYGWSLDFPLFVIPLAYAFFAFYFYRKQYFGVAHSFGIGFAMLIVFNIANYLAYLVNNGWYYNDYESRMFSLYIAVFQLLVYGVSQLFMVGASALYQRVKTHSLL